MCCTWCSTVLGVTDKDWAIALFGNETPSGAIPPSGRQVTFESVDIVEVNAGRISSWRVYLDTASMMAQLGASPALASA